tara:strand:- start:478 stop:990 length:513 start_codon:yes stop_codon:yes gene_type:complete
MKLKKNLVFLGMMGSGKTSIGLLVSKKLNLKFVDIDNEIEKSEKMKISSIFKKKGEKHFRNLEQKITIKILRENNSIISLGGGGFVNSEIRKEILANHFSFWLNWDNKTIINRVNKSKKRPLTYNLSDIEISDLIEKRSKIYSKAMFKIECENLKKSEIVNKVINIYEQN